MLVDTSDLSGGAAPTEPTDGGNDAPNIGPVPEGGVPDADAGPVIPFCTTVDGGFCDDFDDKGLEANWDGFAGSSPGSIKIDNLAFISPPNSLNVDMPAFDAGNGYRELRLRKQMGNAGHIGCEFKIRYDEIDNDARRVFEVGVVAPDGSTIYFSFYAGVTGSAAYVDRYDKNGVGNGHNDIDLGNQLITFPIGTWRKVGFYLDWNGNNPGVVDFTFDGNARPERDLIQFVPTGFVNVYLGLSADTTGRPLKYRADDFACSID